MLIYSQTKVWSVLPWFTCRNPTNIRSMFLSLRLCVEINWKYNNKAFPRQSEGYYLSATFYINKIWYHYVPSWGNQIGLFRTGFLYDWLVLFPCCPRDSQEFNTTAQKYQHFRAVFFMVQLSHPCTTTGKTIALTRQTFVGKVMSLLLNMLSRFVIAFLPRSKCLLISRLKSPSAVILKSKKIKSLGV